MKEKRWPPAVAPAGQPVGPNILAERYRDERHEVQAPILVGQPVALVVERAHVAPAWLSDEWDMLEDIRLPAPSGNAL
jgi:hypothetical protein